MPVNYKAATDKTKAKDGPTMMARCIIELRNPQQNTKLPRANMTVTDGWPNSVNQCYTPKTCIHKICKGFLCP